MTFIAVLDYGIGNLRSAQKALEKVGADARLTSDPRVVRDAAGVVLPGVGNFGRCMQALRASGLDRVALEAIESERPFLGICVGMQMLYKGSDESPDEPGLGVIDARVKLLPDGVKRPQMQWNLLVPPPRRAGRAPIALGEHVPLHLRSLDLVAEPSHPTGQHAEPGHVGRLLAPPVEHLHADADAEERALGLDRLQGDLVEPGRAQRFHAATEVADAGQHDARRLADEAGIGGESGIGADLLERLLGRAEVADAVVEDGDEGHEVPSWLIRTLWPMAPLSLNMGAVVTAPPWWRVCRTPRF